MNRETERQYWGNLEEWSTLQKSTNGVYDSAEEKELARRDLEAAKSREFFSKETPDAADAAQKTEAHHLERREFLQIMGAGLALAASGCTRRPVEKIIPYANQPGEVVPGIANWYASTCQECSARCGTLVRAREGKPVKIEGNHDHPLSQGGLCAQGQASVLNVYDPDRLRGPLQMDKGNSTGRTWAELDGAVADALKKAKASGGKVRVLTGEMTGSSQKLVNDFVAQFQDGKHVIYSPLAEEEVALAGELCFGSAVLPRFRFDKADVVVTLGADFLGTWGFSVEQSKSFSKRRKLGGIDAVNGGTANAVSLRMIALEPALSLTGSNADNRYTIAQGSQLSLALGLLNELVNTHHLSAPGLQGAMTSLLQSNSIEIVSKKTGVKADVLRSVAADLARARGRSILFGAGEFARGDLGVATEIIVNLINAALGNEGNTIDANFGAPVQSSTAKLQALIQELQSGRIDVLLVSGVNPAYSLPKALHFSEALQKTKFVVTANTHADETALLSHWVASNHHSLENWGDSETRTGVWSIAQPALQPLYDTRSFEDSLIQWSKGMASVASLTQSKNWYDYLRGNWQNVHREVGGSFSFSAFWEKSLQDGVAIKNASALNSGSGASRSFRSSSLDLVGVVASANRSTDSGELNLVAYSKMGMGDGSASNNSWLQELPDPLTKMTWNNYAQVSGETAKRLGLHEGDVVRVRNKTDQIELPVHIQPGLHNNSVAIAVGYGRTNAGRVGTGIGANVFSLLGVSRYGISSFVPGISVEKTGKSVVMATTQGHNSMEGRPIIKETTLSAFQKDHSAGNTKEIDKLTTMWPKHAYPGYRWAMAIDLNSCTGCGACVVGCQAENNIPVVGPKDIANGREMHWLRIDRYFSGDPQNPDVAYQPMLCQHCENAPCETVCPVLATTHDNEGLNQQTYNRCVGTRYCANNCPYKVRRFNWFTYTNVEKPLNLQYNPDVTVRTRGVMEKCTFCTHRITDAKGRAKDLGRKVKDGEVVTACQQSCPTEAIVFGDINDPASRIHKIAKNPRGYALLEEINTRPSITYLTKIRHRDFDNEGRRAEIRPEKPNSEHHKEGSHS